MLLLLLLLLVPPPATMNQLSLNQTHKLKVSSRVTSKGSFTLKRPAGESVKALRLSVTLTSWNNSNRMPLLMVAKQQNLAVHSWKLPFEIIEHSNNPKVHETRTQYMTVSRTLCPLGESQQQQVTVELSSSSSEAASVELRAWPVADFRLSLNVGVDVRLTPSEPQLFRFDFADVGDDTKAVRVTVKSEDSVCGLVSLQRSECPALQQASTVEKTGYWQTVTKSAAIIVPRDEYDSFFVVLHSFPSDRRCGNHGVRQERTLKNLTLTVEEMNDSISRCPLILIALVLPLFVSLAVLGCQFICWSRLIKCICNFCSCPKECIFNFCSRLIRLCRCRDGCSEQLCLCFCIESGLTTSGNSRIGCECDSCCCCWCYSCWIPCSVCCKRRCKSKESDSVIEKQQTHFHEGQHEQHKNWCWHISRSSALQVIIIAIFYCTPALQLLFKLQDHLHETGNMDRCFYNFRCRSYQRLPCGIVIYSFNSFLSNIGYMVSGILFVVCVAVKQFYGDAKHREQQQQQQEQEPQQEQQEQQEQQQQQPQQEQQEQQEPQQEQQQQQQPQQEQQEQQEQQQQQQEQQQQEQQEQQQQEQQEQQEQQQQQQHTRSYAAYYAAGFALCGEGVMSAGYHVCPTHDTFQFDTAFMLMICGTVSLSLYSRRHPHINQFTHLVFLMLGIVVFVNSVGILNSNIGFVFLAVLVLAACVISGCYAFCPIKESCMSFTPHSGQFVIQSITNAILFSIVIYMWYNGKKFATVMLMVAFVNTGVYFAYNVLRQTFSCKVKADKCCKCQCSKNAVTMTFLIVVGVIFGALAIWYFCKAPTDWELSPAESRAQNNQECMVKLGFIDMEGLDRHDAWHLLGSVAMLCVLLIVLFMDSYSSHSVNQFEVKEADAAVGGSRQPSRSSQSPEAVPLKAQAASEPDEIC